MAEPWDSRTSTCSSTSMMPPVLLAERIRSSTHSRLISGASGSSNTKRSGMVGCSQIVLRPRCWSSGCLQDRVKLSPRRSLVVIANFSGTTYYNYNLGMPRWGMWRVRFNSDWNGYSGDFANTATLDTNANGAPKDGLGQSANIHIGAYSVAILSQ